MNSTYESIKKLSLSSNNMVDGSKNSNSIKDDKMEIKNGVVHDKKCEENRNNPQN